MSDGPSLAAQLVTELRQLRQSVSDAEYAYDGGHLQRSTRDDVVELTLVRALGLFEEFVGDLFYLALQTKLGTEVSPIVPAADREQAILFVAGVDSPAESRYVTWMPLKEKTLKRAERLLEHGQPFARLSNRSAEKGTLSDLTVVRNRVAHDSQSARAKFEQLARTKGYPSARAADYLTSVRGTDTEILLALARLQALAEGLAEPSEPGSRAILAQEDAYAPSILAPPGTYECVRNRHRIVNASYAPLGDCSTCPLATRCTVCGRKEVVDTAWNRLS